MSETSIKIYKVGEPILTIPSEEVLPEEFGSKLVSNIIEQLQIIEREIGAIGFAAPQIGYPKRIMMIGMEFDNPRRPNVKQFPNMIFINPEVIYESDEMTEDWEGCASIDGLLAYISRPKIIRYRAQDVIGEIFEGELTGFAAHAFLHELDHLNGVLMHTKAIKTKKYEPEKDIIVSLKS